MYVCMFVTLRNANFLYTECTESMAHTRGRTIVVMVQYDGSICTMDDRPYLG